MTTADFEALIGVPEIKEYYTKEPTGVTLYEALLQWVNQTEITRQELDALYNTVLPPDVAFAVQQRMGIIEGRLTEILTTPAEGVTAQEIIDARQGEASLYDNMTGIKATISANYTDIINKIKPVSRKGHVLNHIREGVAHRGYSTTAPENTLPAYTLAKSQGFKYVECDVQWTLDGVPVLLHDSTIDRTTDYSGNCNAFTLEQLKWFDFGSWKSATYKGVTIPTFEEFIQHCKKLDLYPYVEIKGQATSDQINTLLAIVEKYDMINRVTWISFYWSTIEYLSANVPGVRAGFLSETMSEGQIDMLATYKTDINDIFYSAGYGAITPALMAYANTKGVPVEAWTVNSSMTAYRLAQLGVNGITTDSLIMSSVCDMKENLIAYWKMNETSGTSIADLSQNSFTATSVGGISIVDGAITDNGKARKGDGTSGYINTPANLISKTNFKIEFYFKRTADFAGYMALFSNYRKADNTGRGMYIVFNANTITHRIITDQTIIYETPTGFTPVLNQTYKISYNWFDGVVTFRIYKLEANNTLTLEIEQIQTVLGTTYGDMLPIRLLAGNNSTPQEFSSAIIDEVKITEIS